MYYWENSSREILKQERFLGRDKGAELEIDEVASVLAIRGLTGYREQTFMADVFTAVGCIPLFTNVKENSHVRTLMRKTEVVELAQALKKALSGVENGVTISIGKAQVNTYSSDVISFLSRGKIVSLFRHKETVKKVKQTYYIFAETELRGNTLHIKDVKHCIIAKHSSVNITSDVNILLGSYIGSTYNISKERINSIFKIPEYTDYYFLEYTFTQEVIEEARAYIAEGLKGVGLTRRAIVTTLSPRIRRILAANKYKEGTFDVKYIVKGVRSVLLVSKVTSEAVYTITIGVGNDIKIQYSIIRISETNNGTTTGERIFPVENLQDVLAYINELTKEG